MANTERQVVKLLAEEIARAINKKSGGNAATASSALSAKKLTGTISASQIAGSMSAAQISGLNNAIKGVLMALPSDGKAEEGSDDYEIIAVISNLARLEVESFTADTAEIEKLYATFGDFIKLVADEAEFSEIKSDLANIGLASIGDAKIDWAQIEINDSKLTLGDEAIYGNVTIANLSVSDANIVDLYVSKLRIKDNNGKWVAITIDEEGNPTAEEDKIVGVDGQVLADGTVDGGTKIIENSITATRLDAKDIFANRAVINELIASDMRTSVLKASEGEIAELSATTIANRVNSNEANAVQTAIMNLSDNRIAFTVGSDKPVKDEEGNPVTDAEGNSVTKFTLTDKMIEAVANVFKVEANEIDLSANNTVSISASQIKKDYHIGSSEPSDPKDGMLWYDTGPLSDRWYKYDAATDSWVDADSGFVQSFLNDVSEKATDDAVATVSSAELTLDKNGTIGLMAQQITANQTELERIDKAVLEIDDEYIWSSVSSNTEYTDVKQKADSIEFIVDSGETDATKVTFTQNAINAMADNIKISADQVDITANYANAIIKQATITSDDISAAVKNLKIDAEKVTGELTNATLSGEQLKLSFDNIDADAEVYTLIASKITIDGSKIDLSANESITATIKNEIQAENISQIYRQDTVPDIANANENALWICTADIISGDRAYTNGLIYQKTEVNGTYEWVAVQDQDVLAQIKDNADKIESTKSTLEKSVSTLKEDLTSRIDEKVQIWSGGYQPLPILGNNDRNEPASEWLSADDESGTHATSALHYNDLFYDTTNNRAYRWTGSHWTVIQDADVIKAVEDLSNKATIFTGSSLPTPPYSTGDLWSKTIDELYICTYYPGRGADEQALATDWELANEDSEARAAAQTAQQEAEKAKIYANENAPTGSNLYDGKLWLDLSESPPVLKRYDSNASNDEDKWVVVNDADGIRAAQDQLRDDLIRIEAEQNKINMSMALEDDGLHLFRNRAKSEVCITDNSVDINVSGQAYSQFGAGYVQFGNVKMFKPVGAGGLAFIVE